MRIKEYDVLADKMGLSGILKPINPLHHLKDRMTLKHYTTKFAFYDADIRVLQNGKKISCDPLGLTSEVTTLRRRSRGMM